jgi:hypothetical protein
MIKNANMLHVKTISELSTKSYQFKTHGKVLR